ncbi:sensor domain-containing diguanylate cyclase [Piscinibacter gummiphilus]|uniref:Uncharacterized protein n=1 Tax=Piscinibacter gummiphilus TaxID=946333 RepID=A0A1W6L6S5_9BURK|nr:sensor domain-containing diguanylate cyclase [Piscinibacter gummiphilus]ARN19932.1 hypothetical protein A4W93_08405 [Piscinibacter gummiphilus]ATU64606.1 GGDEF domain-containing protein [Piscinibacter gummiphilus]GLS94976.1 diguanylate cyclase [Piscinibacter gummiphilus]
MTAAAPLRPRHLRLQVRVGVCLLILAAAAGCGEWFARRHAETAREAAGDRLLATAREMADRLSQEMAARARDVQALSEDETLRHPVTDPAASRAMLEGLKSRLPQFTWMGLASPDGTIVAATGDLLLGQSIASRPVFQNGLKGLWTGDVHEAVLLAKLVPHPPGEDIKFVDIAAPVRDAAGEPLGVLAAHLSWQWADQLRQTVLRPRGAPASLQLTIVGPKGDLLLPPERRDAGATLAPARIEENIDRWTAVAWSDGRPSLTAVAESLPVGAFRGFGWRVIARDEQAALATAVEAQRREAWTWAMGAGLVVAALAWWAIGRAVRPPAPQEPVRTQPASLMAGAVRPQRRSDLAPVTRLQPVASPVPDILDQEHRDTLTGLGNAAQLERISRRLADAAADEPAETCVLCIDIDGFQTVNERYGRPAGDEVLVQIARRLRQAAREGDSVFRLGGDDFLVLLTCPVGEATALARSVAARVLAELQRPLSYRTLSNLRISGSVGGAVWPVHGATFEEAIAHAGEALRAAKQSGTGKFRLYAGDPSADPARLRA